jgi:GT2 family glycosyltransferase
MTGMIFSVIIVNFNSRQLIIACLHLVMETTAGIPVEIWVVNNASSDGSVAAVLSSFPEVNVISPDTNLGFAKANNQILTHTRGDILLLILILWRKSHSSFLTCDPVR